MHGILYHISLLSELLYVTNLKTQNSQINSPCQASIHDLEIYVTYQKMIWVEDSYIYSPLLVSLDKYS